MSTDLEPSRPSRTGRLGGYLLYIGVGGLFLALTSPLWIWVPTTIWYSYVQRIPFYIMKKGVRGELELVEPKLARGTYRGYWKSVKASTIQAATFPCYNQGWICSESKIACSFGKPRYEPKLGRWKHACWKTLHFKLPGPHYLQYCYRSVGKGRHARYEVRVRGQVRCGGPPTTLLLTRRAHSAVVSIKSLGRKPISRPPLSPSKPRKSL